jgi:hypothetical protein
MPSVRVLGVDTPVDFIDGEGAAPLDRAVLLAGLEDAMALVNRTAGWTAEERAAFEGMKKIVFFQGQVTVNGWPLSRPGCDQDDAIFYWEAVEFMANTDADVRANTFFHDCWHVVQFKRIGDFARTPGDQVAREIDAIDRQIAVARKLGCDEREIQFLRDFRADQGRIVARLAEGVGHRAIPDHPTVMQG